MCLNHKVTFLSSVPRLSQFLRFEGLAKVFFCAISMSLLQIRAAVLSYICYHTQNATEIAFFVSLPTQNATKKHIV